MAILARVGRNALGQVSFGARGQAACGFVAAGCAGIAFLRDRQAWKVDRNSSFITTGACLKRQTAVADDGRSSLLVLRLACRSGGMLCAAAGATTTATSKSAAEFDEAQKRL